MRKMTVETLALSLLLTLISISSGQQPQPPKQNDTKAGDVRDLAVPISKSKLEQMLEQALRHNPDIRVAEAKQREAAAEVTRARLLVTQKVATTYADRETAIDKVAYEEKQVERAKSLFKKNVATVQDVDLALRQLEEAKTALAKIEAEIPSLLGKVNGSETENRLAFDILKEATWVDAVQAKARWTIVDLDGRINVTGDKVVSPGPMTDRIRKALDTPVKASSEGLSAKEFLQGLFASTKLPCQFKISSEQTHERLQAGLEMTLKEEIPLAAALQLFQDICEAKVQFVVRDYGILITDAKTLPEGAMTLNEFVKSTSAPKPETPKKP